MVFLNSMTFHDQGAPCHSDHHCQQPTLEFCYGLDVFPTGSTRWCQSTQGMHRFQTIGCYGETILQHALMLICLSQTRKVLIRAHTFDND